MHKWDISTKIIIVIVPTYHHITGTDVDNQHRLHGTTVYIVGTEAYGYTILLDHRNSSMSALCCFCDLGPMLSC